MREGVIHRRSRDLLALALRQYVSGRITNDDLADVAIDWRDRGAVAVAAEAWTLYDDLKQHKANCRHAIKGEVRREIARWIVFLHSDCEYTWPERPRSINLPIVDFATFGWTKRRRERIDQQFKEAGDFEVWPFSSNTDLKTRQRRPRYLAGKGVALDGDDRSIP